MSVPCSLLPWAAPGRLARTPWQLSPGCGGQQAAPAALGHECSTKVGGLLGRGCERVGLWAPCPLMGNSNTSPKGTEAENICSEGVTIPHPPDPAGPREAGSDSEMSPGDIQEGRESSAPSGQDEGVDWRVRAPAPLFVPPKPTH